MCAKKSVASLKSSKSFEETLWDTANKLRGSVESSVPSRATCEPTANPYKHVVLSLIFLKFVSDKFEERGGANQNAFPLLHSPFSLLTSPAKGEGEIRQKLVEDDLVDCAENQAYSLAA